VESFKLLGATPVPVPYFETYTALQLGTVDGQENPIHAIEQMKFYEVQKYLILSNHQPFTLLAYANKKWFESLPKNFQSILYEEFGGIVDQIVKGTLEDDKKSLEHIRASGTKIIELTPAERRAFQDKLKPVRKKYIEIVGKEGENLLNILDAETEKYSK
jgi:C4-dicarboxylate-binding protein DctP